VRSYGKSDIGVLNEQFSNMPTAEWLRLVKAALPDDAVIQGEQMFKEPVREPPPWTPDGGAM